MVLLPAVTFSVIIVRAARSERMRVEYETAQRQRQIVRLVEADLTNWLFSAGPGSAITQALLPFEIRGERIVFPGFDLSLSARELPQQRPLNSGPPDVPPTPQSIVEQYFPRIEAFRRDLASGRNAGAQYFPRLRALVVLPPGGERGYVVDIQQVLLHVNARLAEFSGAEPFTAEVWIREDRSSQTPANGVALEGFSFFEVTFNAAGSQAYAGLPWLPFPYSMSALVIVAVLGSVFVYRAISQETRLTRLRSDFVAAVSHEFRSPLSSILALAERLERIRDPEKLGEYHRIIGQDARRLSALVTRLLDFAQIEEGKMVYSRQRVDLVTMATAAVESCQHPARPDRIRLVPAGTSPLWVEADPTALRHAIQNLIENAAKYSPPECPVEIHCFSRNGSHTVEVRDRGIGIPLDEQARIFEKFYRGHHVSHLNVHGVGIGLALVRHVMNSHGGSVSVHSQPGEGSQFSLHFPKAVA